MNPRTAAVGVALLLALITGATGYVLGSRARPVEAQGGQYLRRLTDELELRADQITRIDDVLSEADADIERLLEGIPLRVVNLVVREQGLIVPPGNPASSSTSRAGWPAGRSKTATTSPCSAPWRRPAGTGRWKNRT